MLAARHLCGTFHRPGGRLVHAVVREGLLAVTGAARLAGLGGEQVAALAGDARAGRGVGLLGRLLLGGDGLLVRGQVSAEGPHGAVAEFGDLVDVVEEFAVVGHHDDRSPVVGEGLAQSGAGFPVEVVGGLVQEQDRRAGQQQRGQPQQHGLTAGDVADGPVQADVAQAEAGEGGMGPLLHVPVVSQRGEVPLVGIAGLDGVQCGTGLGHTEDHVDGQARIEGQVLREVTGLARHPYGTRGRSEPTRDELEERGLPGPVVADQAGAAVADRPGQILQDGRPVGPGEREPGAQDGRGQVHGHEWVSPLGCTGGGGRRVETPRIRRWPRMARGKEGAASKGRGRAA